MLAVIQCIKQWKHILNYCLFKVNTDASPLKYLTTMKNQSGLFTRWYQELAGFNFTVVNKKGKENSNADALSRSTHMALPPEEDENAEFYKVDEPVIRFEGEVYKIQHVWRSTVAIAEEQLRMRFGAK